MALIVRLVQQLIVSELLHIAANSVCTHTKYGMPQALTLRQVSHSKSQRLQVIDCGGFDEIGNEYGLSPPAWAFQVVLCPSFRNPQ